MERDATNIKLSVGRGRVKVSANRNLEYKCFVFCTYPLMDANTLSTLVRKC